MTTKTILEILQTYHTNGYKVVIDGNTVGNWSSIDNLIQIKSENDFENDALLYIFATALMIRDTHEGKLFRCSMENSTHPSNHNHLAYVEVFTNTKVQF